MSTVASLPFFLFTLPAGALADIVAGKFEKSPAQQIFFYVGLAATLAISLFITRIAKRALAEAVPVEADVGTRCGESTLDR